NRIGQAVGAHGGGAVGMNADAQRDTRIADDERLAIEIAPAKAAKIEQCGRHDACNDGRIKIGKAQMLQREHFLEPGSVFIRGAAGLGRPAPLGADCIALADREDDIGISGIDREEHVQGRKNTSPAVMRVSVPAASRSKSAPSLSRSSNTPSLSLSASFARMGWPNPKARKSQAFRTG